MVAVEGGYQRSVLSIFHHSSKQFLLIKKMAPLTFHQLYAKVNFCCCLRYGRYKELTTLYGLIAARHVTEKEHTSDSVFVKCKMFKQQSLDRKQFFYFFISESWRERSSRSTGRAPAAHLGQDSGKGGVTVTSPALLGQSSSHTERDGDREGSFSRQ